jgi:hypothetical protein
VIYIFHGNHTLQSYNEFSQLLNNYKLHEKFHQSSKNLDIDSLNRFLNTPSLFSETKVVIIENLFSLLKTQLDSLAKLINSHSDFDYLFWQDKKIETTKLKLFPRSTVKFFVLPEVLFSTLDSIRPQNKIDFVKKYQNLITTLPFELILFWFKNHLRRQITTYSKFSPDSLKKTYLNLIELDFNSKTSKLLQSKEDSLERAILSLIDSRP